MEIVLALSVLVLLVGIVVPSYVGYRKSVEKRIHILNAITFQNAVQTGIVEGWVAKPGASQTASITLQAVITHNAIDHVVDPSSGAQVSYDPTSLIQIYNYNASLEYYVRLKSGENTQIYVDTTAPANQRGTVQVNQLNPDNISLRN